MWFFATLLEALKGFLFATSSTILYPGVAMSKRPVLLNQILLIIIIILASCDGTIRSKSDVEELCQAGEYEAVYQWVNSQLLTSSFKELSENKESLQFGLNSLIESYSARDTSSSAAKEILSWLTDIEDAHFSNVNAYFLDMLPKAYVSKDFAFLHFDKAIELYVMGKRGCPRENAEKLIGSAPLSEYVNYFNQYSNRIASSGLGSTRLKVDQDFHFKKIQRFLSQRNDSVAEIWCDSIAGVRNLPTSDELRERARATEEENRAITEAAEIAFKEYAEGDSLRKVIEGIKQQIDYLSNRSENSDGSPYLRISGYVIQRVSDQGYKPVWECSFSNGQHFLFETTQGAFSSQGNFSAWGIKTHSKTITTTQGFQQDWPYFRQVADETAEAQSMNRRDGIIRLKELKEELKENEEILYSQN